MIWIVVDENPWPDEYIQVFVKPKVDTNELLRQFESVKLYDNETDALSYAKKTRDKFEASTIRIFYPEGHSKKISK